MSKPKLEEHKKKRQLYAYASLTNMEIEANGGIEKIQAEMKRLIDRLFIKFRNK